MPWAGELYIFFFYDRAVLTLRNFEKESIYNPFEYVSRHR